MSADPSRSHPELNGLHIEMQLCTRLQHAWATAVETLGIVEKSSFKTGEGDQQFKEFFKLSSALFSIDEKLPIMSEYISIPKNELIKRLNEIETNLQIFAKLKGIALSARHIETKSKKDRGYHLMVLETMDNKITLMAYHESELAFAEMAYKTLEKDYKYNPNISAVLISAGNINEIRKAYPNYFLDTNDFIKHLNRICQKA